MKKIKKKEVVLLAGGVGGAKLAEGLLKIENINLSVICNIGDAKCALGPTCLLDFGIF